MSETITTYKQDYPNTEVAFPMDRDKFYQDQIEAHSKKVKSNRSVGIVDIFIFNRSGEIIIQKRSDKKAHNAGMLDKTIGGHITYGDTTDYTVMVETVQELQVPSITLRSEEDFKKTFHLLNDYLNTVAIIKHIDTKTVSLQKKIGQEMVPVSNRIYLYFGIYDGAVKTVDKEAKGILFYTLDELEKEMEEFPALFTDDVKFFIKKYRSQIISFIKAIQKK